ncbi:hypothetical protein P8452_15203 [Trifolium repens]|nr:hypothetical protein P8452_15203 [Trifolium repens]
MHFAIAKNGCALGGVCNLYPSVSRHRLALCICRFFYRFLTVNAAVWYLFGLFEDAYQDVNIFFPNIIGFVLGTIPN